MRRPLPILLLLCCTLGLAPACDEVLTPLPGRTAARAPTGDRLARATSPAPAPRPAAPQTYRELLAAFAAAVPSRRVERLRPLISRRLAFGLPRLIEQHPERFWKHLDRLRRGIEAGYTLGTPQRRADGRVELPLRFEVGQGTSLLVVFQQGKPRIDRF